MDGNEITFRREGIGGEIQQTCIDHVLVSEVEGMELSTVDFGQDAGDHSLLVSSITLKTPIKRTKEMKKPVLHTLKATDKGAIRKYEKRIRRISAQTIEKMNMEELTTTSKKIVDEIMVGRNGRNSPNGWSPLSNLISLRISVHGTAVKMDDRKDYEDVMRTRVNELCRREKKWS